MMYIGSEEEGKGGGGGVGGDGEGGEVREKGQEWRSKEHKRELVRRLLMIPDIHIFCSPFLLWVLDLLPCF